MTNLALKCNGGKMVLSVNGARLIFLPYGEKNEPWAVDSHTHKNQSQVDCRCQCERQSKEAYRRI